MQFKGVAFINSTSQPRHAIPQHLQLRLHTRTHIGQRQLGIQCCQYAAYFATMYLFEEPALFWLASSALEIAQKHFHLLR